VERKSRFTLLKKINRRTAEATRKAVVSMLKPYHPKTLTITCDNGREFAAHQEIAEELDADVYFAHPCPTGVLFEHASWERGTNENTNGLLRQYFPTDEKVQFAQKRLNQRPRKCLNIRTPEMVFFKMSDVALTT
jgi:IS30 family transposase